MIRGSLYYDYIKSREDSDVIESSDGFLIYTTTERGLFIKDAYVKPELRQKSVMSGFVHQLEGIARELCLEWIIAHVQLNDPGRKQTLMAAFKNGFELVDSNNVFLTIAKKVRV